MHIIQCKNKMHAIQRIPYLDENALNTLDIVDLICHIEYNAYNAMPIKHCIEIAIC